MIPRALAGRAAIVLAIVAAVVVAGALIRSRPSRGPGAERHPLSVRLRSDTGSSQSISAFPELGTVVRILAPDGTVVMRDLPSAAFALEEGQTLDARVPPGRFEAAIEVTFRPRGDAQGPLGAWLAGAGLQIVRDGVTLWSDAAGPLPRLSLMTSPAWMRRPVERLDFELVRVAPGPVAFRAVRRPFPGLVTRPIPSLGRPVPRGGVSGGLDVPGGNPDPAAGWPPADVVVPLDALYAAIEAGRCTDCHAWHARPGTPGAPDLAAAALTRPLPDLVTAILGCEGRAADAGIHWPPLEAPAAGRVADLLAQSAGRLPSEERSGLPPRLDAVPAPSSPSSSPSPPIPSSPGTPRP